MLPRNAPGDVPVSGNLDTLIELVELREFQVNQAGIPTDISQQIASANQRVAAGEYFCAYLEVCSAYDALRRTLTGVGPGAAPFGTCDTPGGGGDDEGNEEEGVEEDDEGEDDDDDDGRG